MEDLDVGGKIVLMDPKGNRKLCGLDLFVLR
jgi:hypothetical protein